METVVQDKLNAVVEKKIADAVERGTATAKEAIERLVIEGKMAKDYIAPIGNKNSQDNPEITFSSNGHLNLLMPKTEKEFSMHTNAVGQIAEMFKVPAYYLQKLAVGTDRERLLASKILNDTSLFTDRSRVLLRSVGGQVRGILSDRYRRMNTATIIEAFLKEVLEKQGALLMNGYMSDTRMYLETIHPTTLSIPTAKNGTVVMAFGCRISSSDYGDGALDLRSFFVQGICLNGAVRESLLRQVHLGSKLPDNIELSEKTYQLDTDTQASAVTDITKKIFSPDFVRMKALEIQGASEMVVDIDKELKILRKKELKEDEIVEISKTLMNNNIEDGIQGENSLWKLVQGITAVSRNAEPQRMREMQEIAGTLMDRVQVVV